MSPTWGGSRPPEHAEPRASDAALAKLARLPEDWDGEGAPKPSEIALAQAGFLLGQLRRTAVEIEYVDPDVMGGIEIGLALSSGGGGRRDASFLVGNTGLVTLLLRDIRTGTVEARTVENPSQEIPRAASFLAALVRP
jgi:hypothetical protein